MNPNMSEDPLDRLMYRHLQRYNKEDETYSNLSDFECRELKSFCRMLLLHTDATDDLYAWMDMAPDLAYDIDWFVDDDNDHLYSKQQLFNISLADHHFRLGKPHTTKRRET